MKKLSDAERLQSIMSNVDTSGGPDACWPWVGTARTVTRGGYPLTRWRGRSQTMPRVVLCIARGVPDSPGLVCRHVCDNPSCCNPAHLIPGTALDNMRDCIERDRRAKKYRAHNRVKKLTDDQVRAIRQDWRPLRAVADDYGVSVSVVSTVRRGKAKAGV